MEKAYPNIVYGSLTGAFWAKTCDARLATVIMKKTGEIHVFELRPDIKKIWRTAYDGRPWLEEKVMGYDQILVPNAVPEQHIVDALQQCIIEEMIKIQNDRTPVGF